jgi:hypothetical protein
MPETKSALTEETTGIVNWPALYPAVTLILFPFGDLLAQEPLLLRTLIVTAVVIGAMSYLLMP